jgi:hypothetical protein
MAKSQRGRVWERAGSCCEYCRMHQAFDVQPFQLDHIRAQKHGGLATDENPALCCLPCNAAKGPNIAGFDPISDALVLLFNPRQDAWSEQFAWNGAMLIGRTAVGRATIQVLGMNSPERVEHRRLLIEADLFPPKG